MEVFMKYAARCLLFLCTSGAESQVQLQNRSVRWEWLAQEPSWGGLHTSWGRPKPGCTTRLFRKFFLQCIHLRFVLPVIDDAIDLFSEGIHDLCVRLEIFWIG